MAAHRGEEKTPFLPADEPESLSWRGRPRKTSNPLRIHISLIAVELVLLVLNIGLVCWYRYPGLRDHFKPASEEPDLEGAFSPATSAVPYEVKSIDVYEPSNFTGEPRHELDVAWSNLLRSTKIRVTEDEMRAMNKSSVSLRDGSGYLGYPEVLHQLHCVKRVYQFRHQDYYTDLDPDTFGIHHWDHCIEVLRRGIMCNADLTIDTFKWQDGEIKGISSHPRTCKNWKAFEEWSDARALHFNGKEPNGTLVMEDEEGAYGPPDLER